jgi:tRNA1(Val) A37 N6-methylase TrmN6
VTANVLGVELVAPLAAAALRNVALNGCSDSVSIVHGDAALLEKGAHVPASGVDVVAFDIFDAGELLLNLVQ